jgi:hypothetical protein
VTGHRITDVTLGLCALVAIAQWIFLISHSGGLSDGVWGCFGHVLLALPCAALGALGYAVRSSPLASTIPLCAGAVLVASLSLTAWAMSRQASDPNSDAIFIGHFVMAWLVVLLTSLMTGTVSIVEFLVRLPA